MKEILEKLLLMKKIPLSIVIIASASCASFAFGTTIYGTGNQLNYSDASNTPASYSSTYEDNSPRVGSAAADPFQFTNAVFSFELPDLGAVSDPFASATFSVGFSSYAFQQGTVEIDLYGIAAAASAAPASSMGYFGANDTSLDATKLVSSFLQANAGYTANTAIDTSSSTVVDYLNAQYDGGAGIGQFVYFRLNPTITFASAPRGYNLLGSTASDALKPSLTFTQVPEPSTTALLTGLFALAGLAYKRYRRNR